MADDSHKLTEAVVARLTKQCDTLFELVKSVESSLADISDPDRLAGIERILSAQETALAELIDSAPLSAVTAAIGELTSAVNRAAKGMGAQKVEVNVPQQRAPVINNVIRPTPITVEAHLPQQPAPVVNVTVPSADKPKKWRVKLAAAGGLPAREMTIEQIP